MKVRLVDAVSPRSDGRAEPLGITVGKEYLVAEALHGSSQYSIINDNNKIARYSQNRFEVTDSQPIEPLRQSFNYLTMDMRQRLKELEAKVKQPASFEFAGWKITFSQSGECNAKQIHGNRIHPFDSVDQAIYFINGYQAQEIQRDMES